MKAITIITALLLFGPHLARGQVLSWEEARKIALERNPGLASAASSFRASEAGLNASYGGFLPELSLSARKSRTTTEVSVLESKSRSRSYSVAASWNLFNGFATVASVNKSRALRSESEARKSLASTDLRQQLRRAYFAVYVQQEKIRLFEKILKRQVQNEKLVSLKYGSGTEAKWNVMKTAADRERAEYNLNAARTELNAAQDQLARLLHLDSLPYSEVDASGATGVQLPAAIPGEEIVKSHPELAVSYFTEQRLAADKITARAAFLPSIDLSYSKSREKSEIGARTRTDTNTVALVAQWNIFNGLTDFFTVQQANITYEAARLDSESVSRRLLNGVRSSFLDLRSALQQLPVAKSARVAAEERVRIVSTQYRSGLKSYLDWEQAESRLLEVEQQEVGALQTALNALADFERASGILLEEP